MNTKQFLLEECENVRSTLQEALRHDYSAGSSEEFYKEFRVRLTQLSKLIESTGLDDVFLLRELAFELSLLSTLLHKIERSHAGEFSWPFAERLKNLAIPLCRDKFLPAGNDPIIRVYAEGGLGSYKINLEDDLSRLFNNKRIFTIVFPRTLKHHVLLHTIFGHEIGHAAWIIPAQQADLKKKVLTPLRREGPLTSSSSAEIWLEKAKAPTLLEQIRRRDPDPGKFKFNRQKYDSWFEEFMCDLFGVVTFGPSFVAAHQTLLLGLDPTGYSWGPRHPPYACRKAMLRQACKHLHWDTYDKKIRGGSLRSHVRKFLDTYLDSSAPDPWEDVFTQKQVADAVDALNEILTGAGTTSFTMPDELALSKLIGMLAERIPPCGSDISGSENPKNHVIDFRYILMAGWIASSNVTSLTPKKEKILDFSQINKLCEMGILHQRAIDLNHERKKKAKP